MFHRSRIAPILVVTAAVVAGAWPTAAFAATQPRLGTALNFAAIAGSTITNTGPTVIKGNVALSPGSAITGFPPGISAVRNIADANAVKAKTDLVTAFTDAASAPSTSNLTGKNLGGLNLTAGVYSFSSSAQLTGKLTLSGTGVFIFRIGSALTTATASAVLLRNGAQACAVYWEVGSSATLGSATQFQGNLMALTSITMVTGANIITGRAMARNGALTLDTNQITPPSGTCTAASTTRTTTSTPTTPSTGAAAPGSALPGLGLLATIVGGLMVFAGRRRPRVDGLSRRPPLG
jgi:Ice-binding-like